MPRVRQRGSKPDGHARKGVTSLRPSRRNGLQILPIRLVVARREERAGRAAAAHGPAALRHHRGPYEGTSRRGTEPASRCGTRSLCAAPNRNPLIRRVGLLRRRRPSESLRATRPTTLWQPQGAGRTTRTATQAPWRARSPPTGGDAFSRCAVPGDAWLSFDSQ